MVKPGQDNIQERVREFNLGDLVAPPWYSELYPTGRDSTVLEEKIATAGYDEDRFIAVRIANGKSEILHGVQRYLIESKRGRKKILAIVKSLDDEAARRYTVECNLYSNSEVAPMSLVQAIVLAQDAKEHGGEYKVEAILKRTGYSKVTYKRTLTSLIWALKYWEEREPSLAGLGTAEKVARIIRNSLSPRFTSFYTGEIEPSEFWRTDYITSEEAKGRRLSQAGKKSGVARKHVIHPEALTNRGDDINPDPIYNFCKFVAESHECDELLAQLRSDRSKLVAFIETFTEEQKKQLKNLFELLVSLIGPATETASQSRELVKRNGKSKAKSKEEKAALASATEKKIPVITGPLFDSLSDHLKV